MVGIISNVEKKMIEDKLSSLVYDDIGFGDITTGLIENKPVTAEIIAKSPGIICGLTEAIILFEKFNVKCTSGLTDGSHVEKGQSVLKLDGTLADILAVERTVLNIMMKLSSIASSTRDFVKKAHNINPNLKIAATRKTTPGFRYFEKRAVIIGGGDPHRWRLDDMILIKDTHLDAFKHDIRGIIEKAKSQISFSKKIEIEVENGQHALLAARSNADIIMLDNMKPEEIKKSIALIKDDLSQKNLQIPLFEASGNISMENIEEYAEAGIDIVSTSLITLNPHKQVDLSLKIRS